MSIGFGSDRIGFQIAELSTALVEFYKRSMDRIQAKAKSGDLTPQGFAEEQASLYLMTKQEPRRRWASVYR